MLREDVEIRNATVEDAKFVAWTVLTALDMDDDGVEAVMRSCKDEMSLYSWRHARIATVNGCAVGCLISYEGTQYMQLRDLTWSQIWGAIDEQYLSSIEAEAYPGEFYLDSMAILPEYRGYNIGKWLLLDGLERGKERRCQAVTLIVSVEKPHLCEYYKEVGFHEYGQMEFFGHCYKRLKVLL
jgi:ribosomal protein S18 acetylase RimI-like enzyme